MIRPDDFNVGPQWLGKRWWLFGKQWPVESAPNAYWIEFPDFSSPNDDEAIQLLGFLKFQDNSGVLNGRISSLDFDFPFHEVFLGVLPLHEVAEAILKERKIQFTGVAQGGGSGYINMEWKLKEPNGILQLHYQVEEYWVISGSFITRVESYNPQVEGTTILRATGINEGGEIKTVAVFYMRPAISADIKKD